MKSEELLVKALKFYSRNRMTMKKMILIYGAGISGRSILRKPPRSVRLTRGS